MNPGMSGAVSTGMGVGGPTAQDATPRARLSSWEDLGRYLERDEVLLLGPSEREESQAEWRDITRQEENLDDRLLIGLVGGTGVGKSTFINALAGEEVSRSSDRRPTTDRVVAYRHVTNELPPDVPMADLSQPQILHRHEHLEKVIVLDFPDFDSAESMHRDILERFLPHLDVLFIVADDVKYGDRRLYDLLGEIRHNPENLYFLFNKIDRLQARYAGESKRVLDELQSDLLGKLREHAGIELNPDHVIPIAALRVLEHRRDQGDSDSCGEFHRVVELLDGYRQSKRREAAKEYNLEARKSRLRTQLFESALSGENRDILEETSRLVETCRKELEATLSSVSPEVILDAERKQRRLARLRRVGPCWGFPFSMLFTLVTELRFRRAPKVQSSDATLGDRIYQHYRSYFEALRNLRARFTSELSGSRLASGSGGEGAIPPLDEAAIRAMTTEFAAEMQRNMSVDETEPGVRERRLIHLPGVCAVLLIVWSVIYPAFASFFDSSEAKTGFFSALVQGMVAALQPGFLIGAVLGVLLVYAIVALALWGREVQKLDARIIGAERSLQQAIRERGSAAIDILETQIQAMHAEFRELKELVG